MRQRITGLTTMSMVGIGDMTTIETGTIAFIDAGIMMETVAGVVDDDAGLRTRRHYGAGETIVAFRAHRLNRCGTDTWSDESRSRKLRTPGTPASRFEVSTGFEPIAGKQGMDVVRQEVHPSG